MVNKWVGHRVILVYGESLLLFIPSHPLRHVDHVSIDVHCIKLVELVVVLAFGRVGSIRKAHHLSGVPTIIVDDCLLLHVLKRGVAHKNLNCHRIRLGRRIF